MNSIRVVREVRGFVGFAIVVFVVGLLIGYAFPEALSGLLKSQIEHLKELAKQASAHQSQWYTFELLFVNNFKVSLILIAMGIPLSILSIAGISFNGAAVGYVLASSGVAAKAPLWAVVGLGILPHGIFEIPAFLLAGAMGIRWGYVWLRPFCGKTRARSFGIVAKEVLAIIPVIAVLLVVAALVESFVTPRLLSLLVG